MTVIDLRSDTVTKPTREMREAMTVAEVGDDVFGDDPTVQRLESIAQGLMGKEAAVLMPSGTMGNLAAVLAHCARGDEVILGDKSHTFLFEAGGIAALGGVHPRTVPTQPDGTLSLSDVAAAVRDTEDLHQPPTRLVCVENTHNMMGGLPLSVAYMDELSALTTQKGLVLHVDGARIFDAASALGVSAARLVRDADSVTFCLSKGLAAPVGSVLCGDHKFIARARRIRKQLGGGMRQAGILAAAGIVAVETMVQRISEDHKRAKTLAAGLFSLEGLAVEPRVPATNMVFVRPTAAARMTVRELRDNLERNGIRAVIVVGDRLRMVVHYEIDDAAVERTIATFQKILVK